MKTQFTIEVPFFPGYYESWLYSSDADYDAVREEMRYWHDETGKEYTQDDFEVDYKSYEADANEVFINAFLNYAPICVDSAKFSHMISPAYYNYSTDRLFADMTLSPNWKQQMRAFINANSEWLEKRIKDNWTSYGNSISFIENHVEGFYHELFDKESETYINIMLTYMMLRTYPNIEELLMWECLENISISSYINLKQQS